MFATEWHRVDVAGPERLALHLYLLKSGVTAAAAAPGVAATPAQGAELGPAEEVAVEQFQAHEAAETGTELAESGWVETWAVADGVLVRSDLPSQRDGRSALAVRATPGSPQWLDVLGQLAPNTRGPTAN